MSVVYEVTAKAGTYTTKDGEEKTRYHKMGVVMQTKNGLAIKIESLPISWDGWAYLNEPRPKSEGY